MCNKSVDQEYFMSGSNVEGTTEQSTPLEAAHSRSSPSIAKAVRDRYLIMRGRFDANINVHKIEIMNKLVTVHF